MKINFREWLFVVSVFVFAFYSYSLFSYFGIENFLQEGPLSAYFDTNAWHLEIIFTSIVFGTLFLWINRLTEKKTFRKRSFGFNILLRSTLYIISLAGIGLVLFYLFSQLDLLGEEELAGFESYLSYKLIFSFLLYWMLVVLLINFVIIISRKLGPGTLVDLLTGKYYHPQSDEFVFLFLDLKDSTRIAEQLGHKAYSNFIKECIHELTPVIQKHRANVYQYVGDEVVLYWKSNDGLRQLNCLHSFFDFDEILQQQKDAFLTKYGEAPQFKAGMDTGIVTLTEIGDIKREIAFHGDVLNTASRLEKKCNEFNTHLIISQHIIDQISADHQYQFRLLSDLPLRGKTQSLNFYAVSFDVKST